MVNNVSVVQIILLGLIAFLGYSEWMLGSSLIQRPIVLGALVGLVFGDFTQGIIIGGTLELVFMGIMSIGASIPPDVVAGGVLGTAFAITSGQGAVAVALALPIATLLLAVKNAILILIVPIMAHRADKYAEDGDVDGVSRMHIVAYLAAAIPSTLLIVLAFCAGNPVIEAVLNKIPPVITNGLGAATGLLPALGFGLLASLIMTKKLAPFFFLGFLLAAYLKIPVLGIAIFAIIIVLVTLDKTTPKMEVSVDDNEF